MRCGYSTQKMWSLALFWNQSIEGLVKKQKPFIAKAIFWEAIRCPSFSTNVVHFVNVFLGIISGQILSCICSVFPPLHVCCLLFSIADFKPIISLSVFIWSELSGEEPPLWSRLVCPLGGCNNWWWKSQRASYETQGWDINWIILFQFKGAALCQVVSKRKFGGLG